MSQQRVQASPPVSHPVKRISFFGRPCKVVMQNQNGPCPLLAIANVLSLRNELKLPSGTREITQSDLITAIVDLLLERSKHYEAAYAADYQQNISDVFPVLQKLTTGVDVNVKFHSLHAFEPTPEVAVFDLLGIPLVHGWLVDPADAHTCEVFGNRSYNELVELLFLVLGDEQMELLSSGPLRSLSLASHHHLNTSFSQTGSPRSLRASSSLSGAAAAAAVEAASGSSRSQQQGVPLQAPPAPADVQRRLHGLSLQEQQQQLMPQAGGLANGSAGGGTSTAAAAVPAAAAAPGLLHQQQQQGHGAAAVAAAAPADVAAAPQGLEGPEEEVIEGIVEDILQELCCEVAPGRIELGDSPTRAAIRARQLAYAGPGPSRLVNGSSSSSSGGAVAAASSNNGEQQQQQQQQQQPSSAATGHPGGQPQQPQRQPPQPAATAPPPGASPAAAAADAAVVRAFLEANCSQLTHYGLGALLEGLKEHQLAVFFRNNHFNTLFRYEAAVYLLVTDQGYEYEPDIVWERLDGVNGDTTFCRGDFAPFVPHREPSAGAGGDGAAGGGGGDDAARMAALTDLDAAIAASLAVSEPGVEGGGDDDGAAAAAAAAVAAAAAAGEHHEDADYALALQLQLQEEEAVRLRREREQQQQQQQQAAAGGQQPHGQQQHGQQQAEPLTALAASVRSMGQRIASGVQQQYAATAAALTAAQQADQQALAEQQRQHGRHHRRSGPGSGGGAGAAAGGSSRRSGGQEEKCSIM